jgi:predicted Zn-dependent peptidase
MPVKTTIPALKWPKSTKNLMHNNTVHSLGLELVKVQLGYPRRKETQDRYYHTLVQTRLLKTITASSEHMEIRQTKQTNSVALSPRTNYTD